MLSSSCYVEPLSRDTSSMIPHAIILRCAQMSSRRLTRSHTRLARTPLDTTYWHARSLTRQMRGVMLSSSFDCHAMRCLLAYSHASLVYWHARHLTLLSLTLFDTTDSLRHAIIDDSSLVMYTRNTKTHPHGYHHEMSSCRLDTLAYSTGTHALGHYWHERCVILLCSTRHTKKHRHAIISCRRLD